MLGFVFVTHVYLFNATEGVWKAVKVQRLTGILPSSDRLLDSIVST